MSRSLVCLALLAFVAAAAAAPPKYSCNGKIDAPANSTGPKTLPYAEWTTSLLGDGGKKVGTFKICWNRQGLSPASLVNPLNSTAVIQWAAVITNVEAYKSMFLGLANGTNILEVGRVSDPPIALAKKLDVFGVLPKIYYADPGLSMFLTAGCTADPKTKLTGAGITVGYMAGTPPTEKQYAPAVFKLSKGACNPALP